jgi:hypothetical protein
MKTSSLFLLSCIFLLHSCHSGNKKADLSIALYLNSEDKQLTTKIIDSIAYLPLMETEGSYFSDVRKLKVTDDYIFIFDASGSRSLLCFLPSGEFVRKIGARGNGPGEYSMLWDFDVDKDNIYLYDRAKKNILIYSMDGRFVTSKPLPFRIKSLKVLPNTHFLFAAEKEASMKEGVQFRWASL